MESVNVLPEAIPGAASLSYVSMALAAVVAVLAIITVINVVSLAKLKKRYESFMYRKGPHGISIENLLDDCLTETRAVGKNFSSLSGRVNSLENKITGCFQKIGVVRYNPFDDTGGDLSYVIALLDENNTGFILNGIYNRSGSYTYAKEIQHGAPVKHKLSAEEHEALQNAIDNGLS